MISDDEIRYNQAFAKAQFDYDHAEPEYEDYPEHDKPVVNMFSDNKRNYYELVIESYLVDEECDLQEYKNGESYKEIRLGLSDVKSLYESCKKIIDLHGDKND